MRSPRVGKVLAALVVVAAGATLATPGAVAHGPDGEGLRHLEAHELTLEPQAREVLPLFFAEGGGTFDAGWVFLLNALPHDGTGPVSVRLEHNQGLASAWTLDPRAGFRVLSGHMPWQGVYALVFENNGPDAASLTFFYDQSCNCASKMLPIEVPEGLLVFAADVAEGDTWRAGFLEPPAYELAVQLAWREDERSRWPQDFRVLNESTNTTPTTMGPAHYIEWTAEQAGTYHFFVEPVEVYPDAVDPESPDPRRSVLAMTVLPHFEQLAAAPAPAESPAAPLAWLLAGALAALLLGRRRP